MWGTVEAEYTAIVNSTGWLAHFNSIKEACEKYNFSHSEAEKPKNSRLNRYVDVYPFDHSRVVLKRGDHDYINANIVKMTKANRKYILTQGPLASTTDHFWLMVWEQDCRAILMLNKIVEKEQVKCHWYWPYYSGPKYALTLENGLNIEQISSENYSHFITRVFKITDVETNKSREVTQFHYKTWPDFGVPSSPNEFLDFLIRVRESGALEPTVGPAVVHCSAGIGRSGTFCLVDSCLVLIENEDLKDSTVKDILLEMRKDRMGLVQTADQLRFSYSAIIEGAKRLFDPDYVNLNISYEVEEEESPPPLPPRRIESLRNAKTADEINDNTPTATNIINGNNIHSDDDDEDDNDDEDDDVEEEAIDEAEDSDHRETLRLQPPNKDLPEAPSSESEYDNDASMESEKSGGLRQRAVTQAALTEKVQQMKRKQREAEKWNQMKRSLYKPMAITFGIIVCGAIVYIYMKN